QGAARVRDRARHLLAARALAQHLRGRAQVREAADSQVICIRRHVSTPIAAARNPTAQKKPPGSLAAFFGISVLRSDRSRPFLRQRLRKRVIPEVETCAVDHGPALIPQRREQFHEYAPATRRRQRRTAVRPREAASGPRPRMRRVALEVCAFPFLNGLSDRYDSRRVRIGIANFLLVEQVRNTAGWLWE